MMVKPPKIPSRRKRRCNTNSPQVEKTIRKAFAKWTNMKTFTTSYIGCRWIVATDTGKRYWPVDNGSEYDFIEA